MDRAGQEYWDALWEDERLPAPVDPRDKALSNYVFRKYHELFTRVLPRGHKVRLLEVGCARSRWLPYFAAEHGYEVTGLDYSTTGCEQARQILAAAGVEGRIVEGDLFSPPEDLLEAFDVVVSFGLVEHFDDTTAATEALGRFLVPGGTLVTVIPNHRGIARRPDPAVREPPGVRRSRATRPPAVGRGASRCGTRPPVVRLLPRRELECRQHHDLAKRHLSTPGDARIVGDEQGGVVVGGARVTAATEPPDIAIRGGDCAFVETRH